MKKRFRRLLAGALTMLMCGAAQAQVELLAVNVGKGDALVVRAGDYTCLIDAGKEKAQDQLELALKALGVEALDAVFLTHTDKDHSGGLKWLRKSDIEIRAIYASRYHPNTSEKKHPAVKAAKKLKLQVNWLGAGDSVPLGDSGAVFRVLAPISEVPDDEDDNSLVMLLESPDGRMLLTGDMEHVEEAALLASGADLHCDVLKVANHGDSDATGAALIAACAPSVALISTSSEEKPGTPDAGVVRSLQSIGCAVYVTQDASLGIRIALDGGRVSVEHINP